MSEISVSEIYVMEEVAHCMPEKIWKYGLFRWWFLVLRYATRGGGGGGGGGGAADSKNVK